MKIIFQFLGLGFFCTKTIYGQPLFEFEDLANEISNELKDINQLQTENPSANYFIGPARFLDSNLKNIYRKRSRNYIDYANYRGPSGRFDSNIKMLPTHSVFEWHFQYFSSYFLKLVKYNNVTSFQK